ncbi:MAG TPA: type II and III secretion system protein family protein [Amaricoccus sp.]|nr:type II and III secretion system protein family protein [Amaricoccus sp.]
MNPLRKLGVAFGAALALAPVIATGTAQAFELVEPQTERRVELVVGTGQLIRVDEEFSSLFVANPAVADIEVKSPRLLYLTGVGVGETTLFAVDDNDNVLMSTVIRVTHNVDALQEGLRQISQGGGVTATTVDQSLVLTGTVNTPEEAANAVQVANQFVDDPTRVVNRMNIQSPTQVNLQVRIVEVARNVDRRLGIQWGAATGTNPRIGFFGGGAVPEGYTARFQLGRGSFSIDVLLQALAEEGLVTIMAEPNLTARSGEGASFLAGGEFPYSVVNDDENTVSFKDYGIGLNFTPTVLDGDHISLKVATEVSELDFSNVVDTRNRVPGLKTRRAETTVDLASGQSFAIAGLMQNTSAQTDSKLPGLGTLPVIGALFKSNSFQRGQTELVVIVTPIIVKPTSGKRVATPLDGFVPPNDFERILLGRFQNSRQVDQVQNRIGQRRLVGQSGFVFE